MPNVFQVKLRHRHRQYIFEPYTTITRNTYLNTYVIYYFTVGCVLAHRRRDLDDSAAVRETISDKYNNVPGRLAMYQLLFRHHYKYFANSATCESLRKN